MWCFGFSMKCRIMGEVPNGITCTLGQNSADNKPSASVTDFFVEDTWTSSHQNRAEELLRPLRHYTRPIFHLHRPVRRHWRHSPCDGASGGKCCSHPNSIGMPLQATRHFLEKHPLGAFRKFEHRYSRHDSLVGGFPCQAFSIIGDKKGFGDTRGTLFFEIERILRHHKPKAFLLENVRNLVSHDAGRTFDTILRHLEALGYSVDWRILNALDFNLPQKRERVIIVGFRDPAPFSWPQARPLKLSLESILESDDAVPSKYFASPAVVASVKARLVGKKLPPHPWICHENKSGNISPLPFSCALRAGASYNYLLVNGKRRLTPRESLPDSRAFLKIFRL